MKFRTEITITSRINEFSFDPALPCALAGSCFAANVAAKMRNSLWDATDPLGALYNPLSILEVLKLIIEKDVEKIRDSLFEYQGSIHSRLLDSSFSSESEEELIKRYSVAASKFWEALQTGKQLIITFGTAWVYELKETGEVVANCHKLPGSLFNRFRLGVEEISDLWIAFDKKLRSIIPYLKIIFTVSPVRHLKDGFNGNTVSKAILNLAVEKICNAADNVIYFPSYEIMMDDLRDYRFYSSDLVHPSNQAIDYIWEKFIDSYITPEGKEILKEGSEIVAGFNHRQLVFTEASQRAEDNRIEKLRERYRLLLKRHPHLLKI